jgi:hypothetical protein
MSLLPDGLLLDGSKIGVAAPYKGWMVEKREGYNEVIDEQVVVRAIKYV